MAYSNNYTSDNHNISKKAIKGWLENYDTIVYGDRRRDSLPGNSGPKPRDGISYKQLNKMMLTVAVKDMPIILKKCLYLRWVKPAPLGETLRQLGMTKDAYYRRCNWVIDFIYYHINNLYMEKARLLNTLSNKI